MGRTFRAEVCATKLALAALASLLVAAQCDEASLTITGGAAGGVAYDFGDKAIGSLTQTTLTVRNTGNADAVLGTIDGAALGVAAPFSLVPGSTCVSGGVVTRSSGTCTLKIAFAPTAAGGFSDAIEMLYTSSGAPESMRVTSRAVSGTGSTSANCFDTGCSPGYVCKEGPSSPGTGKCVSIPPPPPNCMAPCIFELARSCVPTLGACNQWTIVSSTSSVRCDTQTHWASLLEYANRARTSKYQREGTTCYTESYYFESGAYRYTDGTNIVATAVASAPDRRLVACDASTNFTFEEIASPECDEWKSTYLLTGCRTSQDGSCEGLYSP